MFCALFQEIMNILDVKFVARIELDGKCCFRLKFNNELGGSFLKSWVAEVAVFEHLQQILR